MTPEQLKALLRPAPRRHPRHAPREPGGEQPEERRAGVDREGEELPSKAEPPTLFG